MRSADRGRFRLGYFTQTRTQCVQFADLDILTQAAIVLGICPSANRRVAGYPVTGLPFSHQRLPTDSTTEAGMFGARTRPRAPANGEARQGRRTLPRIRKSGHRDP
jgi:hypothetical protein